MGPWGRATYDRPVPWVIDLDGVVWLAHHPIPGSVDAIAELRGRGEVVVFATNNSSATTAQHEEALARIGVDATGAVISSARAAAALLSGGERVLVVGGPGLHEAVTAAGCEVVPEAEDRPDVVIAGLDRAVTYERLRQATLAIRSGARFVLTNPDATYPTPWGLEPGAGAIGAFLATAGGAAPAIGGKPEGAMVDLIRDRFGSEGVVVGDRLDTDGRFAMALGYRFALVLSGVATALDRDPAVSPTVVVDDLAAAVASRTLAPTRDRP